MTLTKKEKDGLLLGTITSEKTTDTYKNAVTWYADHMNIYKKFATVDKHEMWFDAKDNSIKFEFHLSNIDQNKYKDLSKKIDKAFDAISVKMDEFFNEMTPKIDALFKKIEPTLSEIFAKFDEIFDGFFDTKKKTKKWLHN